VSDIDRAQRYVHVEYFMFADDAIGARVIDALIHVHKRGVACCVLLDHLGNFSFNRPVLKWLRAGGIAVQQMLPMRPFDNQWNRPDLRNHRKGVRVYPYQSPVLLHSKILSIDDIAVLGSSNGNIRSFQLDLEVTLVCYNRQVVVDMQQVVDDYLRHSRPLQLGTWKARS
jgi:phosphatidylserine/phosphatidylglycerophosphate/cardiolipin synthase-like enzyme